MTHDHDALVHSSLHAIMLSKVLPTSLVRNNLRTTLRSLHTTPVLRDSPTKLTNILAGANAPATQVKTVTSEGIHLEDGRIIPGPCIFLEGKVYLWNVPSTMWEGWNPEHFEVFDLTVPKPGAFGRCGLHTSIVLYSLPVFVELLLLGTGNRLVLPPPSIRQYLGTIGVQADFMDTVCLFNSPLGWLHGS